MERKIIVGGRAALITLISKLGFVESKQVITGAHLLKKDSSEILFIHVPAFDNPNLFSKITAGGVLTTSHLMVDIGDAVKQILQ